MSSHRSEASGTNESTNNSSYLTPTRRSPIWEFFERELVLIDGIPKAVCKYCGAKLTSNRKSGTNSLRSHIAEYCPKIPSDDRNRFVATMKKKIADGPFTFNCGKSRELMITWVLRTEVAFNKFEDESFEPWMASLQPTFSCIGRQTVRNDCVAMFQRMKNDLRVELQSNTSRICVQDLLDFLDFFYENVCKTFDDFEKRKKLTADWLVKYFKKYQEAIRANDTNAASQANVQRSLVNRSPVLLLGKRKVEQQFAQYRSKKWGSQIGKSELEAYLEEEPVREDETFEILTWWKTNSNKYPVLSAMARDFLAIPLSTVSSESAFSLSGRILGDNRSSMTPETLEALVCCKDWLYKYPTNEGGSMQS